MEVRQRLQKARPETLGQAARMQGITPAAISVLLVYAKRGFKPDPATPAPAHPSNGLASSGLSASTASGGAREEGANMMAKPIHRA